MLSSSVLRPPSSRCYRPANPVVEIPATIRRWKMLYRISGGRLAITAAAIVIPRC
jgi:hypothetical protein